MYTIKEVSKLSGVSKRTLRYYDAIDLLKPTSLTDAGYRLYDSLAIDRLQHILMYKKLGFNLSVIKQMINDKQFDQYEALCEHLKALNNQRDQLDQLIHTIEKTIQYQKGEITMKDQDKFEGLKAQKIKENEKKYGIETRQKYGDDVVVQSNQTFQNMSKKDYQKAQELEVDIMRLLEQALKTNNAQSEAAIKACKLHQTWIQMYWPTYSKQAHLALVDMYLEDERFKDYYERAGKGATKLLCDAMHQYLG